MVVSIETEKFYLPFYISNSEQGKIDLERLKDLSTDLGFPVFTRLIIEDAKTHQVFLTEVEYWVTMLPARRQTQYLLSKMSIAKDNKSRDAMTGQVAGSSKGSSLSAPQEAGMLGRGCVVNALEFAKCRGGDLSAGRALMTQLINTGGASLDPIMKNNTSPTIKNTVASYLTGAHLQHNL